ncbi:MAG: DUF559 domain-containing protein [Microbacterium sp.]
MDVHEALYRHGGYARVRTLVHDGVAPREIEKAVAAGHLLPPRRGWVIAREADPAVRAALEIGAVISCVSRAARLGLWEPRDAGWHVALAPNARLLRESDAHVHWAKPLVPRHPDSAEDSIENALVLVAKCQPYEQALAVWESALRLELFNKPRMQRLPLPPAAREICEDMMPYADSGAETMVIPRLRWLRVALRRQVWIANHRVDLLIGERLVLQIDGAHHIGAQRDSDNAHDARLRLMGYHVIRISLWQIMNDWAFVQDAIARAVAQGLHLAA